MELDFQTDPAVLGRLVDDLAIGIFSISASGCFLAWSKGAEHITGYLRREVVGQPCTVLDPFCQAFCFVDNITKASGLSSTDRVAHLDSKFITRDGQVLWLHFDVTTFVDRCGLPDGTVGCFSDISDLLTTPETVNQSSTPVNPAVDDFWLLGTGSRMREVQRVVQLAGRSDHSVFLAGEPGTGKKSTARVLHHLSPRRLQPFVSIKCSNMPEDVLDYELFGCLAGALPGVNSDKVGRLAAADHGTLFVDDIDHLSPYLLSKLMRAVHAGVVLPIGATEPSSANIRLVASACHLPGSESPLAPLMDSFVKGFTICLPSLRDRLEDLPVLADHFMRQFSSKRLLNVNKIDRDAMLCMMNYAWPGNVKELSDVILHAFATVSGNTINLIDLPKPIAAAAELHTASPGVFSLSSQRSTAPPTIPVHELTAKQAAERNRIISVLQQTNGNKTAASKILGFSRVTMWKKVSKYGIE